MSDTHAFLEDLAGAIGVVFALGERRAWRSNDPFDLLRSPYAKVVSGSDLLARVWIQLGKRTGESTRRLLRVPEATEPKAISDFLRAAMVLATEGDDAYRPIGERLAGTLASLQVPSPNGGGWGLTFPYASRFGRITANDPNIYTTLNACQALLDAGDCLEGISFDASVDRARRFLLDDLGFLSYGGHCWLRYSRGGTSPIVNVQASAADFFARLAAGRDDEAAAAIADGCAATVIAAQSHDGSWPYSADGRASFIDGYHTGFTIEGLAGYADRRGDDRVEGTLEAVAAGMAYFKAHLVDEESRPLDFADGRPTDDPQTAAQCAQTLVLCGEEPDRERAGAVWRIAVAGHLDPEAQRLVSFRWSVGPSVLATAHIWAELRREG